MGGGANLRCGCFLEKMKELGPVGGMVATGTGKPGKWGGIFQSGNFVKTGKVSEFYSKYWINQKKLYWKTEKNTGNVMEICQPVIVKILQIWYQTLNKKRTLKNTGNCKKTGKVNLSV